MADSTHIQWTEATWNPTTGCRKVSPGCDGCYAIRDAHRMGGNPNPKVRAAYQGLTQILNGRPNWTGEVRCHPDRLEIPLRWRKPRKIFVDSQSDLFHEEVPDEFIAQVFAVMGVAWQHQFQVLTKRAGRMQGMLSNPEFPDEVRRAAVRDLPQYLIPAELEAGSARLAWPLANVWVGVSVEDQRRAFERVPFLVDTPAAVHFLSCEPLLGAVHIERWLGRRPQMVPQHGVDWVIVGGESGPGARPMDLVWMRTLVDQCRSAGVACFVKQMGRWVLGDHDGFCVQSWLLDDYATAWVPPVIGGDRHERPLNAVGFGLWDRKGGDPAYWPEALRVREFPQVAR